MSPEYLVSLLLLLHTVFVIRVNNDWLIKFQGRGQQLLIECILTAWLDGLLADPTSLAGLFRPALVKYTS